MEGSISQEFLPGTEYELETIQDLLSALQTNSPQTLFGGHEIGITKQNGVLKVEPGAKALRSNQQELLEEEKALQQAIALSVDPKYKVAHEVIESQQRLLDQVSPRDQLVPPVLPLI